MSDFRGSAVKLKKFLFAIIFTTLLFVPQITFAEANKIPVIVIDESTDSVGQRLVYKFKEEIRQSSTLSITLDQKAAALEIQISTMDRLPDSPGLSTMYSVVWVMTLGGTTRTFYYNSLGYCGGNRVDEYAEIFLARTDQIMDEISVAFNDVLKNIANNSAY
jgi:hypothetical protein